jgi:hypothetical protein
MALLELPHWLIIAGAVLVFAGLVGLALNRNKDVDSDPVLLPGDTSEKRNADLGNWIEPRAEGGEKK